MDLWIRTQDKRELLKVNDGFYIANGFSDTTDTFIGLKNIGHIGRYKTEKRALEVLDEINDFIENPTKYYYNALPSHNFGCVEPQYYANIMGIMKVYKMPKE